MKTANKLFFTLFVALMVSICAADDQQVINQLCRFRIATIPHPNPALCHLYVQCVLTSGEVRECPIGNIFVENELCVPGNRFTCQRDNQVPTTVPTPVPTPPIQTTPPQTTPPSIDRMCDNIQIGFLEDPRTCRAFILCVFGIPDFIDCPSHAPVFDASVSLCVPGNPDTCEIFGQTPPTTLPPVTLPPTVTLTPIPPITIPPNTVPPPTFPPPTIPPIAPPTTFPPIGPPATDSPPAPIPPIPPFEVCIGNNLLFVADPLTCFRYYFCFFGVPLAGECDPDRIFEANLRGCVLGNRNTCTRH